MTTWSEPAMSVKRRSSAGNDQATKRRKRLNGFVGGALLLLLALAPLPFGAVHAFTWGVFGLGLGLLGIVYSVGLARIGIGPNVSPAELPWATGAFALYCLFLVLQLLPLGAIAPSLTAFWANGMEFSSSTISVAANQTALMLLRHLTYGLLFFLMLQASQNPTRREFVLNAILLIIMGYCLLGIVSLQSGDTVLGLNKTSYMGSATGPFVNRNSYATYLAIGAMIALVKAGRVLVRQASRHSHDGMVPDTITKTLLYATGYLLLVGVIFATNSRMGIVVTMVGSILILVILATRLGSAWRLLLPVAAVLLVATALAVFLFGESVLARLIDDSSSSVTRIDLYQQTWQLIWQRPWLGFGGGAFEQAFAWAAHAPVGPDLRWDRAHNTYLSLWSEMGLIVGSLPVVLFIALAVRLVAALVRQSDDWAFQAIGLSVLVVVGLHSLVDFSLEIQANALLFTAVMAVAVGSTLPAAERRSKAN
ncbi:O-antigen ligase family protein [Devosia oryziradicis]|uniref:O-antigen ligase family protein n=1 Tax=Devosia oryziradicis TaxID=2801335 RepID=A0ABX7C053_9HYPH|nr:O-antigen ligase family protein [Devosia oryziradicis]QQR35426.1 O-antigen ligase family protein [Devosia oryziradicis]